MKAATKRSFGSRLASRLLLSLVMVSVAVVWNGGAPASAMTSNERFVDRVYRDFLLRSPTSSELIWGSTILGNSPSRGAYLKSFFYSQQFQSRWVDGVYYQYMSAAPSQAQASAALADLDETDDFLKVELDVLASNQYMAFVGGTNHTFVEALYWDVLARDAGADQSGWDYWTGRLDAGTMSRRQMANYFIRSSEGARLRVGGTSTVECIATEIVYPSDVSAGSYCLILDRLGSSADISYWAGPTHLGGSGQLPTHWVHMAASSEYFTLSQS